MMKDNDLITRREAEIVLLKKGQKTERYEWGETWELNFDEIREALSEYQSEIVRCKDCKFWQNRVFRIIDGKECNLCEMVKGYKPADWFCADGKRKKGR